MSNNESNIRPLPIRPLPREEKSSTPLNTPERTLRQVNRQRRIEEMNDLQRQINELANAFQHQQDQFADEKKQMADEIDELKNQQVNQQMVSHAEMKQAEGVNYFANVFIHLAYPAGANMAAVANWQLKQWDDYLNSYQPLLTEVVDAGTWFGVYENSCNLQDIPIQKRFKKLIAKILGDKLRAKLVKKPAFFAGLNDDAAKYLKLRKWLCTDDSMMKAVTKAQETLRKWVKNKDTLLLNYQDYVEHVDNYIYSIRFGVTHGIRQSRFDVLTEAALFKLFIKRMGEDRIRQEAEKFTRIRNISTLGVIVKQLNNEVSIPTEYQDLKPPRNGNNTPSLMVIDGNESTDEPHFDEQGELYYVNRPDRPRRYYPSRSRFGNTQNRTNQYNRNNRNNRTNNRYNNNRSRTARFEYWKLPFCALCISYGHKTEDCLKQKYSPIFMKLDKEGKKEEIKELVAEYRQRVKTLRINQDAARVRRETSIKNTPSLYNIEHANEYDDANDYEEPVDGTLDPHVYLINSYDKSTSSTSQKGGMTERNSPTTLVNPSPIAQNNDNNNNNNSKPFAYSYPRKQ